MFAVAARTVRATIWMMKAITMMELRRNTAVIIQQIRRGRRFILKYRGRPAGRLEPMERAREKKPGRDPFYSLAELAAANGESLSNADMDRVILMRH